MQTAQYFTEINTTPIAPKKHLQPVFQLHDTKGMVCSNCRFVNQTDYHFCTNCGYPISANEEGQHAYNKRLKRRKAVELRCTIKILKARNALYVFAAIMLIGLVSIFSADKQTVLSGVVMLIAAAVFAGLGRWSLRKPFTALLIGLMLLITFAGLSTWAMLKKTTGFDAVYLIFIQGIFIYFLWQGVKAAFHADILESAYKT